jgi:hypothetical protein
MSNLFGALIGASIDRRDGDGGIKGAIAGTLAGTVPRSAAPVIATNAFEWVAQEGVPYAMRAVTGRSPALARTVA